MTRAAEALNGRPLKLDADPFAPTAANHHSSRQVQTAFQEIVRQVFQHAPVILVTGPASAGKTFLVDMTARLCLDMGLPVRRVDRGDLLHTALDQHCDVLLVDEANSVEDRILESFSPERRSNSATTTIFLGLPSCAARFASAVDPVLIQLDLLSRSDAECYLRERAASAGFPELFSNDALELIVDASNGSPRVLRRIASEAFFNAASDGAFQIGHKHAAFVLAMQLPSRSPAHHDKQSVAAEDTPLAHARIDDARFLREKDLSQIDGALPRVEGLSGEPIVSVESALNLADTAPNIRQNGGKLGDDLWIDASGEISVPPWEMPRRRSAVPTLARRGVLAACAVIVIAAAVLGIAKPWIGTGPVASNLAALPPSQPAAAGATGGSESTTAPLAVPTAPPAIPKEVENISEPEPIQSAPQNVPQAQEQTADSTRAAKSSARQSARSEADVAQPLTAEEEAAVARGVREMERAATQARLRLNRR